MTKTWTHVECTPEFVAPAVAAFQKYYKTGQNPDGPNDRSNMHTVAFDATLRGTPGEWHCMRQGCYAPTTAYPRGYYREQPRYDAVGIAYVGVNLGDQGHVSKGKEALDWMTVLMDKDGAFGQLLPYLYQQSPEQVLEEKGIIFKDLHDPKCNPGLLWTFALASRRPHEYSSTYKTYLTFREKLDPQWALFCTFALAPNTQGQFSKRYADHGSVMGCNALIYAQRFLNADPVMYPEHTTSGPARCFLSPRAKTEDHSPTYGKTHQHLGPAGKAYPLEFWLDLIQQEVAHGRAQAA